MLPIVTDEFIEKPEEQEKQILAELCGYKESPGCVSEHLWHGHFSSEADKICTCHTVFLCREHSTNQA